MISLTLFLHLAVALLTGCIIACSLSALILKTEGWYRNLALSLGIVASLQILSGTLLALLSPSLSAASLSLHIGEYLGICLVMETLLFIHMRKISLPFPTLASASPVFVSLLLFSAALAQHI